MILNSDWREKTWSQLAQPWDILVIGGGITGAGILREAARLKLRVLLVEQRDFAWGTSSRSSKLVHGGLRYLKEGRLLLTRDSVQERQHLLQEGPGLIDPLGFLMTVYKDDHPGRWAFELGLTVYDLLALQWAHRYYDPEELLMLAPHISRQDLQGGFRYGDAQTDDARLVFRVICEAVGAGGFALNYVQAQSLLRAENGQVLGACLQDRETGRTAEVHARLVVNATGAWADHLRNQVGAPSRIRPLRGSHLIFSAWRLPVAQAVSFLHPMDRRPVFIFPWEGITLVGTTDVDHNQSMDTEPCISSQEVAYLMAAVESQFPMLGLGLEDVTATFAGVRPVIGSGQEDPSKESRDHVIWQERGLLTVTGGKLTTFRLIARQVLQSALGSLGLASAQFDDQPVLDPVGLELLETSHLDEPARRRLVGRYGAFAAHLVKIAQPGELETIPGTPVLWAELRWAARAEAVHHLDDLLLRRVRLGLMLPQGGAAVLEAVRAICQAELDWDDARWQAEQAAYLQLWQEHYSVPDCHSIPDWRELLAQNRQRRFLARQKRQQRERLIYKLVILTGLLASVSAGFWLWRFWGRQRKM